MKQPSLEATDADDAPAEVLHARLAILGAGLAGLGIAIRLKQRGERDFVILERADTLGGTWRDNIYPGCACDVQSQLYSFSFALNPHWSRAYSPQAEIWAYMNQCAKDYDIFPHIRWHCELQQACWDEDARQWQIATSQGPIAADMLVLGQGPLSEPKLPNIPGIEQFAGTLFHSSHWNDEHDLSGEHVAVIGTGASAIQIVPNIQPRVRHLALFMRTPPWILPRQDHAIPAWRQELYRRLPLAQRFARGLIYLQREFSALAFVYRPQMMRAAERLARAHLAAQIADPDLRAQLTPHYVMGCKRILLSDDFYPAVAQPNVELVTEAIKEIRPHSIVTADDAERAIDTIICATGFHVTDMPIANRIVGRDRRSLAEAWHDGIQAYLGTTVAGFPNLFLLIGPNTGLGHTSMIYMMESQFAYILDALRVLSRRHATIFEVQAGAQARYNAEIQKRLEGTVWLSGCASWYLDARGRNTTLWPGFTFEFRRRTRRFDSQHYLLAAR
jgi:cation diffusion facilitator CzcD-associated flavoprotein CzcO